MTRNNPSSTFFYDVGVEAGTELPFLIESLLVGKAFFSLVFMNLLLSIRRPFSPPYLNLMGHRPRKIIIPNPREKVNPHLLIKPRHLGRHAVDRPVRTRSCSLILVSVCFTEDRKFRLRDYIRHFVKLKGCY